MNNKTVKDKTIKADAAEGADEQLSPARYCEKLLRDSGGKREAAIFAAFDPTKKTDSVNMQIFALNRYWRRELGLIGVSTIDAREALLDDCTYKVWRALFERNVLPVILSNHLPGKQFPL